SWKTFENFGIPTAASLIEAKSATSKPLIASGGIRNGLQAVKAIALGAELVGIALPALREASKGRQALSDYLQNFIEEMRISMALVGAKNLKALRKTKPIVLGRTKDWLEQRKIKY
ncbi:alpha-hydroxy-acid oxidizing protein, partial [archaeon]|nr:alpha-hydroxy-acid oxidizing protein [archaeon]